jgi:nitrate/TMAO reductase-like tetraheme cytochrome c subunit
MASPLSRIKETFADPKRRVKAVLIGGAVLLAVPIFLSISLTVASNPAFCGGLCHDQQPEYQSWRDSSHSSVPCYACHMKSQNPIGFFMEKAKDGAIGGLKEFVTGVEYPINKDSEVGLTLPKETCERCHNMSTRYITPRAVFSKKMTGKDTKTEKKFHTKHLDLGITCAVCHNRVAHNEYAKEEERAGDKRKQEIFELFEEYKEENEETGKKIPHEYENFLDMKGCTRCHTSAKNRNEEVLKLFPQVEEANPPKECTTCHDADWEGMPVGHGETWGIEHGAVAKKDFGYCMKCHDEGKKFATKEGEKYCVLCHGEAGAARFK